MSTMRKAVCLALLKFEETEDGYSLQGFHNHPEEIIHISYGKHT